VEFGYEKVRIPYVIHGWYIPDFIVDLHLFPSEDKRLYIEQKDTYGQSIKRKMVAVRRCNPTLDIRLVFYAHNKKYIKWAEKNGFPWAVGEIPKEC